MKKGRKGEKPEKEPHSPQYEEDRKSGHLCRKEYEKSCGQQGDAIVGAQYGNNQYQDGDDLCPWVKPVYEGSTGKILSEGYVLEQFHITSDP